MTRRVLIFVLTVCLTLTSATAWAFWSAGSGSGANGQAAGSTVNRGATPTAIAVKQVVTVNWAASTLSSGQAVTGYRVNRYNAATPSVPPTVLSSCAGTIVATTCVESNVPEGAWTYAITPVFADNWTGLESAMSATVTVDVTAPATAITLSGVTGGAYKQGNTVFYRGAAAGSFRLANAVTDAGSGPASSQTATLGNTPTGWTHSPSSVSTPVGGPYVSAPFSWSAGASSSPSEAVTGRDVVGNTTTTNVSFVNDSTAPTGTIAYAAGYQSGASIAVTLGVAADAGSGIATRQLQRANALLTAGTCGSFTAFSNLGQDPPPSVYLDSQVSAGSCYKYRYVVTDRVGNQNTATGAEAMVDYPGIVASTSGLLSYWRLGEAAGTRAFDSKGTNTGDYKNGPTLGVPGALEGDANTAAQFDGIDDYVQMTAPTGLPAGSATRSVEAWFKTSATTRQVLFNYGSRDNNREFGLWLDAGGTSMTAWGFGQGNDKTFATSALNNGQWHQVVKTYDGTSITLYIDGVALPSQVAVRATLMDTYGFGIGAVINPDDVNSRGYFTGSIDEVSFYSNVMSAATVSDHFHLGKLPVAPEPMVTATSADLPYVENGTTAVDATVTVVDRDSTNLVAATVSMTTNYVAGQDTLAFSTQNGITGTWTAASGVLALSGTATVAQYQTALRSITYSNNSNYPSTAARSVSFEVTDGTHPSNLATRTVTVSAVNDAPSGTSATVTMDEDVPYVFGTASFGMTDPVDNGANALSAVKVRTLPILGALKLSGTTVTIGQSIPVASIASGLLTYVPVGNANGLAYATFTFQVQDDGGTANSGIDLDPSADTFTFNVTAVNDAPVIVALETQATWMNSAKVFSTGNGNLVSIADVDAPTGPVKVQLVSTNGAATLSITTNLLFSVGDGTADATMTFTGTIAAVNAALSGLSFTPATDFTGAASLQILTDDQGNSGTGGAKTDSETVTLTVTNYSGTISATNGLLSYWRLGEGSGSTMADSKGTNAGTYVNTPTFVAGAVAGDSNKAVQFNGTNEYATVARKIQANFSIEFWFKSTQPDSFGNCTSWWQGAGLIDADVDGTAADFGISLCAGRVVAGTGGNPDMSIATPGTFNNGAWHHVVFTRTQSGGAMALYVDGALRASGTGSTAALTSPPNISIGRSARGTQYYDGSLDEVAFYDTVLSATQVAAHYPTP